ncbi:MULTISPECIES: efflux RND transporter periplasmic adaptor subunit [Alcanivorax]|uniref:efflux RND transporter periplasmic adaptor subunit n=1 Tax=Alcanivorax TaxID=59753 RepID=UPI00105BB9C6|nr:MULTISPECIES: efflux RND transporter periplasmic adaptor subunit [Alcanivorax]
MSWNRQSDWTPAFRAGFVGLLLLSLWESARAREPVSLVTVTPRHLEERLPLTGTLTADRAARLSTSVAGLVIALQADVGDQVKQGQVLLELDGELNRLALAGASAAAEEAEARLADARRRFQEASTLVARRSIAASEVRGLEAEVAMSQAALASARAEQRRQHALLARHVLKAPFDGVISAKQSEIGEWVTPGTAVLELVSPQQVHADLAVPQEYYPRVSGESRVELRLGGDAGPAYPATIAAIVPVNDPNARTFLIRATLTSTAEGASLPPVTPGMSVRASLFLSAAEPRLAVPRDALVRYPDGRVSVWVAEDGADGALVAREQRLRVGDGLGDWVAVQEGLSDGDRVVVRGNESLRDGRELDVRD